MTISVFVFSTKFNLMLFRFIHAVYVFLSAMLFMFSSKHNFSRCLYIIYICMAINAGFFYFFESTSAVLVFTWQLVFMWVLAVLL